MRFRTGRTMHGMHRPNALNTAVLVAAMAAVPLAMAAPPAGAWRWVRTVRPERAVAGTYGPAVAAAGETLLIGPLWDADLGDSLPRLSAISIRSGFGLPGTSAFAVEHPRGDRGAGFAQSVAAAEGAAAVGSPFAGCPRGGCSSGQAHLVALAHDGTRSIDEIACPEPQPASEFGAAVTTDGLTVAIGSPRFDGAAVDSGAVDIYELQRTEAGVEPVHAGRLLPPDPAASARFGAAVAVDGEWMAIGEPGSGPRLPRAGNVHLARRVAGRWRLVDSLRASAGADGWLGATVALAGGQLAAGAPIARDAVTGHRTGAVARWSLRGGAWVAGEPLVAPQRAPGSGFGMALAIREGFIAVGAPGDDAGGEDAGSAWIGPVGCTALQRLQARSPRPGDGFGAGLAFGSGQGRTPVGPTRFLAVTGRPDPEQPAGPGTVELFGYRPPDPVLLAHPASPQSRSASAIAIAADASVTGTGRQPDSSARASAAGP